MDNREKFLMDSKGSHPIFDAAYFRDLAAKYEAAEQREIAAKLTQVATEFEKIALTQEDHEPAEP
jgi:hypothetical protein